MSLKNYHHKVILSRESIFLYRSGCERKESQMFMKKNRKRTTGVHPLAGESVKKANIKQHRPTNRPNKRPWKSIKDMRTCGCDFPAPTIWSRAPGSGSGSSWNIPLMHGGCGWRMGEQIRKCSDGPYRIRFETQQTQQVWEMLYEFFILLLMTVIQNLSFCANGKTVIVWEKKWAAKKLKLVQWFSILYVMLFESRKYVAALIFYFTMFSKNTWIISIMEISFKIIRLRSTSSHQCSKSKCLGMKK